MSIKRIFLVVFVLLGAGSTFFFFIYLKPIAPPKPTGVYSVGATNFDISFASEILGEQRKLNIRIWYPTNETTGNINIVSSKQTQVEAAKAFGLPELLAVEEPSYSYLNARIADSKNGFPVVIFNHGFGSFAEQNTVNTQELASHGYIVMAISHPETSLTTEYTDGTVVLHDPNLPAYVQSRDAENYVENSNKIIAETLLRLNSVNDFEAYWQAMRDLAQSVAFANLQPFVVQWVEDSNALITALKSPVSTAIPQSIQAAANVNKIGIMGHSLGGMVAVQTSINNPDISAVMNFDAPFMIDVPTSSAILTAPTCFLMADKIDTNNGALDIGNINVPLLENSGQPGCNIVFEGARHMNFTDLNYLPILTLFDVTGPVDHRDFGHEFNNAMVYFFDKFLKGSAQEFSPVSTGIVNFQAY